MNKHQKTKRIRYICDFLNAGGGKIKEMETWVNYRLEENGLKPIGRRTLQSCIEYLRNGDFEHSLNNLQSPKKKNLFKIQLVNNKIYKWGVNSLKPEFGDLDENERFTLPFLAGILRRYESIPAVQKILYQLPEIFNITEKEMYSSSAIFHSGPILYDETNSQFEEKVINCVINILRYIHYSHAIEFNYTPVNYYENSNEKLNLHQVAPLEIRYYENYYYLIAAELKTNALRTYRVDQIHRFKLEEILDDNDKPILFDKKALENQTNVKKLFKESMGVFPYNASDAEMYEIKIKFTEWAASYMKRLKYHHSQRIIEENRSEKYLIISIMLRLKKVATYEENILNRNQALSFLLKRFGEFASIISYSKI